MVRQREVVPGRIASTIRRDPPVPRVALFLELTSALIHGIARLD